MAWPYDPDTSQDYLVWDKTETIQYLAKDVEMPPGGGPEITNTLWRVIRKDRLSADSILIKMDMTVNIPFATAEGIEPKMQDIIIRGDGTHWVVGLVEIVASEEIYRVRLIKSRK